MSSWRRIALAVGCTAALSAQDPAAAQAYVRKARSLYLNLRTEGLDTFKASVVPDWEYILQPEGSKEAPPEAALAKLRTLQFFLTLDGQGATRVTHRIPEAAANPQMEQGFQQITSGMEQMLHGFFATWNAFMLNSPFPADGVPVQMAQAGTETRLSFRDGEADILLVVGPGFILRRVEIRAQAFTSILEPDYIRSDRGLALSAYHATYTTPSGKEQTRLEVQIGYAPLQGLLLPSKLQLSGAYEASPFHARIAFKDAEVTKRTDIRP